MDDRRKALIEVRDLLREEGWAPVESEVSSRDAASVLGKKPVGTNPILAAITLFAVATTVILLGANHDLRAIKEVSLAVVSLRIVGPEENLLPDFAERLFITIDGERVWGPVPRSGLGQGPAGPGSPPIETDSRSRRILQLWEKGADRRPILLGQLAVSSAHPIESPFEVKLADVVKKDVYYLVRLKVIKEPRSAVASSAPSPRI